MDLSRYLVFGGQTYYPCGGWRDFRKSVETIEEAFIECNRLEVTNICKWTHFVDTKTNKLYTRDDQPIEWFMD